MRPLDSIVYRRQAGDKLRRLRDAAGKTQAEVMEEMAWSRSKMNRIESGAVGIARPDLIELLRIYGVTDEAEVASLISEGSGSRRHSSFAHLRPHISPEFHAFLAYEAAAVAHRSFHALAIPGILQVEEYAQAVTGRGGHKSAEFVSAMIDLRQRRQELLTAPSGPSFSFLLSETAISIRVGDNNVMRAQIRRLRAVARQPNVTLRIVPFEFGLHAHWRESYVLLEVADQGTHELADLVLFFDSPQGDFFYVESAEPIRRPSAWLRDHDELEERVGDLDTTMAHLDAALARFPRT